MNCAKYSVVFLLFQGDVSSGLKIFVRHVCLAPGNDESNEYKPPK